MSHIQFLILWTNMNGIVSLYRVDFFWHMSRVVQNKEGKQNAILKAGVTSNWGNIENEENVENV